jgi:uncharacterized membrane protein YbaN (DUF454 family)
VEGQVIAGLLLTALGTIGIAFSLLEMAAFFVDSGHAFWRLMRRLSGRDTEQTSQMQAAMFWVQAFGLLLGGCVLVYAGLSVWEG